MSDIQKLRLARWERIKRQGIWRFVFVRGVLGWGLPMAIFGIIFERVRKEAFLWYMTLGLCLVGGFLWGLAMWFVTMRIYPRVLLGSR